jgi:DNA polymerase III delta subunit
MLYFLYGNDTAKSRKKLHELLDSAQKKRPDAEIFKVTSENWSEGQFDELLVSRGLFEAKYTVVLDNLFEKKDVKQYFLDKLDEVGASEQIFLVLEGGVLAGDLKKIEKAAKQVQEFKKAEAKERTNIFAVANGLVEKDKKKLWISLVDFLRKGIAAEEIHGILFWQVKNMLLAGKAKDMKEAGLSPFAYKNALTGSRQYRAGELEKLSGELVDMTHRVRQGEGELSVMLEKWVLGL